MFQNKKRLVVGITLVLSTLFIIAEISGVIIARKNRFSWEKYLEGKKIEEIVGPISAPKKESTGKKNQKSAEPPNYIVIDTARNILSLKKGDTVIKEAVVSCGSGNILQEPDGKRKWVFDTPRGEFKVLSKLRNPVWVKPDWAFIEEGEEIPKKRSDRLEAGVLGDYAMGFGDGFFIHGTLYTRLLGRNVTHGCIRMGDDDLKTVYKAVSAGTKIYIF